MKFTFFKVGKKADFPQFFKNSSNGINVGLAEVFKIDKDIIGINGNKNIKYLSQDFNDITLESVCCIKKPKRHYLILEVVVSSSDSHFLFITFFYLYLMVSIPEIYLKELFCLNLGNL